MKKLGVYFLTMIMLFSIPLAASSSCLDCAGGYLIDDTLESDYAIDVLDSASGIPITSLVEDIGGEVNFEGARSVALPQGEIILIPAGENEKTKLNIVYIKKGNSNPLVYVIESPTEIYNLLDNHLTIYLPSGEIIPFEGFGTSSISNIQPSINWTYCMYWAICQYLVYWPAGAACYWFLYQCLV